MVTKHYVRTTAGELHYRSCGDSGPNLVMLQILPFATIMFDKLLPLLAQAGLRCTAIDLMGYGRSDKRPASWMVEDFAANIDEALNVLGIQPEFMLGGHFAGMVAASVTIGRPDHVRRLVLDGTPVWPEEYRRNIAAEMGVKPFTVTEDGQFMVDVWNQVLAMMRLLNAGFTVTPDVATPLRDFAVALLETTYGPSVVPAMAAFDMSKLLPRICMETLILTSENDSQVKFFETLRGGIAGARGRVSRRRASHARHRTAGASGRICRRTDRIPAGLTGRGHGASRGFDDDIWSRSRACTLVWVPRLAAGGCLRARKRGNTGHGRAVQRDAEEGFFGASGRTSDNTKCQDHGRHTRPDRGVPHRWHRAGQ